MVDSCCVIGCNKRRKKLDKIIISGYKNPSFFRAKTEKRRSLWQHAIGRPDLPKNARVCSEHFLEESMKTLPNGRRELINELVVPTLNIGTYVDKQNIPNKQHETSIDNGRQSQTTKAAAMKKIAVGSPSSPPKLPPLVSQNFMNLKKDE